MISKRPSCGLWIPPRIDLEAPITPQNPAHIDHRLRQRLIDWLDDRGYPYFTNQDFRKVFVKNNEVWMGDRCLNRVDHFFWMGMIDRSPDSFHLEVLRVLEMSTKIHNSYTFFSTATDKFRAFSQLHQYGVPVPELYLVDIHSYPLFSELFDASRNGKDGRDKKSFLLKPRRSAFGKGIIKIDDYAQLRDTIEYLPQKSYYLERFYENDSSQWLGLTVINGEVIYGFRKESQLVSDWKVYDSEGIGGSVNYIPPPPEAIKIAKDVYACTGGNYFGLDLIKTSSGYRMVDINCSPGLYFDFIEDLKIDFAGLFLGKILES